MHTMHTKEIDTDHWWLLNLSSSLKLNFIDKVVIYNRRDCCQARIDGVHVRVFIFHDCVHSKCVLILNSDHIRARNPKKSTLQFFSSFTVEWLR